MVRCTTMMWCSLVKWCYPYAVGPSLLNIQVGLIKDDQLSTRDFDETLKVSTFKDDAQQRKGAVSCSIRSVRMGCSSPPLSGWHLDIVTSWPMKLRSLPRRKNQVHRCHSPISTSSFRRSGHCIFLLLNERTFRIFVERSFFTKRKQLSGVNVHASWDLGRKTSEYVDVKKFPGFQFKDLPAINRWHCLSWLFFPAVQLEFGAIWVRPS